MGCYIDGNEAIFFVLPAALLACAEQIPDHVELLPQGERTSSSLAEPPSLNTFKLSGRSDRPGGEQRPGRIQQAAKNDLRNKAALGASLVTIDADFGELMPLRDKTRSSSSAAPTSRSTLAASGGARAKNATWVPSGKWRARGYHRPHGRPGSCLSRRSRSAAAATIRVSSAARRRDSAWLVRHHFRSARRAIVLPAGMRSVQAIRDLTAPRAASRCALLRAQAGRAGFARAAEARKHIEGAPMPKGLENELRALWRDVGERCPWGFAVRSSATCEDGALVSMAGLADSILGVRGGDGLALAVRQVVGVDRQWPKGPSRTSPAHGVPATSAWPSSSSGWSRRRRRG